MYENYATLWGRIARQAPGRTALRCAGEDITYERFDAESRRLAGQFAQRGIGAGDRVALYLHNTVEYLTVLNACLLLEAVPVSVNYRYIGSELAALLEVAPPAALVYGSMNCSAVEDAVQLLDGAPGCPRLLVSVDSGAPEGSTGGRGTAAVRGSVEESVTLQQLLEAGSAEDTPDPLPEPSRDAELYVFTGGTTGRPKAVVWRIGDLLHIQQSSIYGPVGRGAPADLDEAVQIAMDESLPAVRTLPLAPFIHATALFSAMNTLALGGTVVIYPRPRLQVDEVAELIVAEQVTRLIVAGDAVALPVLDALESELEGRTAVLGSVISSGMRFSDETKARLHALGDVTIVDILASTEGGPYAMATTTAADQLPARFRLTEDAVVLDGRQQEVQDQPGAVGVLAYRGALPLGYLDDPVKTEESYPVINGVRHCSPGDHVRVRQDGSIELLGRGSSVVNTGGEKVFPGEVEEMLLEVEGIEDAVVFGVPDPRWGEAVAAVVAVQPGIRLTQEAILDHLTDRLAGYKKPRVLVLRDSLDRGPTGKLDMRRVKQIVQEGAA